MKGYVEDIKQIESFFRDELQCEVRGGLKDPNAETFRELSKSSFKKRLRGLRDEIERNKTIKRLFIFVLSHGGEYGIETKPVPNTQSYQPGDQRDNYITAEEIIAYFTHDQVPSMKHYPKCFFIQVKFVFLFIYLFFFRGEAF